MAGNLVADIKSIFNTGYAKLVGLGLFVWISVPILNTVFGTSVMVDTITTFNNYPIYLYRGLGGGLIAMGLFSYAGFRWG